jgi:hypothetical protein
MSNAQTQSENKKLGQNYIIIKNNFFIKIKFMRKDVNNAG